MIKAFNISKTFQTKIKKGFLKSEKKPKLAVDDISLHIAEGEMVGYIGPNGAGKSTTIKMLTGILLPDSGQITVNGIDPFHRRKENGRNIGVIFGQRSQLWWHLRLDDTFRLFKHMYEIPDAQYSENLKMLKRTLELDEFWHQPVRQLSLGQRMRGELAAAMLHSPKILYLDEPTVGMDVVVKERIRELLKEFNSRGVTILLTTHDLDDVERLCKRVMVINHGKLLFDGTMASLRSQSTADTKVTVEFDCDSPVLPPLLRNVQQNGRRLTFSISRQNGETELLAQVIRENKVMDVAMAEPPIEEVVRSFYTGGDELK
ncbi:MAG: ABC transporter ATP-binding protein [Christensenellales bacterium]|jgi:ABC-2 type transport system ATP-binding protein